MNSVGLQEVSGQTEKKNKFGGLGNTVIGQRIRVRLFPLINVQMAHSAAGGVGFGAGRLSTISAVDKPLKWFVIRCCNWQWTSERNILISGSLNHCYMT